MGGMFMIIGHVGMFGSGHISAGVASVALNVLVNLYPIFMQRANRYELLKVKKRKIAILEKVQESDDDEVHNYNS